MSTRAIYTAFPRQGEGGMYDVYVGNLTRRDENKYVGTGHGIQLNGAFENALILHRRDFSGSVS